MTGGRVRVGLVWRLLAIPLLMIALVMAIVWFAVDYLAADYFMTLMKKYEIESSEANAMFLEATHRALLWAGAAGLGLGAVLSFLLTRRLLTPLGRMLHVTRQLAAGDYSTRVAAERRDEIGELGQSFNQMAESLQRIEHLRRRLLIDVAHELRTPLTNVRGYLEALKDGVVPPSREVFESLHDETLRLAKLVDDLMQLSRAEAAGLTLRRAPVGLDELARRCLKLFQVRFEERQVEVEVVAPGGPTLVHVDVDKVAQAIHNLLDNALTHTPVGGHVRLAVERDGATASFSCANTGDGIPADDLPLIFERLYRADRSRSRDRGGATRVWFTLPLITKPLPEPYDPLTSSL